MWQHRPERERLFDEVADDIRNTLAARKSEKKRRAVLSNLVAESQVEVLIELDSDTDANDSSPTRDDGV